MTNRPYFSPRMLGRVGVGWGPESLSRKSLCAFLSLTSGQASLQSAEAPTRHVNDSRHRKVSRTGPEIKKSNVSEEFFGSPQKSPEKYPKESKNTPQNPKCIFLDFFWPFQGHFCGPPKYLLRFCMARATSLAAEIQKAGDDPHFQNNAFGAKRSFSELSESSGVPKKPSTRVSKRTLFPLATFKNAPNPKFVQNLSQRLLLRAPVSGTETCRKFVI